MEKWLNRFLLIFCTVINVFKRKYIGSRSSESLSEKWVAKEGIKDFGTEVKWFSYMFCSIIEYPCLINMFYYIRWMQSNRTVQLWVSEDGSVVSYPDYSHGRVNTKWSWSVILNSFELKCSSSQKVKRRQWYNCCCLELDRISWCIKFF